MTSISSDKLTGDLVIAGCGDGAIRLFDKRMPSADSLVLSFEEHKNWVVNVQLQRGAERRLISGSTDGDVRFWDSRFTSSVSSIDTDIGTLSALSLHDYCPIFAVGSESQQLKTFHTDGTMLSHVRYHEGFLGQRIAPVTSLAFHPNRLLLSVGGSDQLVSVLMPSAATLVPG